MGEEKPGNDKPDSSNGRPESVPLAQPTELKNNAPIANAQKAESAKKIFEPFFSICQELKRFWVVVRRPENSNGIIAVATVVIAGMAFLQWLEMHDAGIQTDKIIEADNRLAGANERFATAMEGSVTQAKNAFDAANGQAILTQRAWIAVTIQPHTPFALGQLFDIRVGFKNTSRTPALNVKTVGGSETFKRKDGRFRIPDFSYTPEKYIFNGSLTPNGEFFGDTIIGPLNEDDVKQITSETARVFLHGRVEYDDVFGVHHWQNYCGFLVPMGVIAICPYHTEMDQNK
jgi:hypothetical protein